MRLGDLDLDLERLTAPLPIWHGRVSPDEWRRAAPVVAQAGGRLVALWAAAPRETQAATVQVAYAMPLGLVWLTLPVGDDGLYPDLAPVFPAAGRMQRAAADLCGVRADGADDQRPWLDHGLWRMRQPLRTQAADIEPAADAGDYAFVRVEGDGVHEIPVGPVHAGIIEPGHFRFSVVGEKVLRLEPRLGYVHKGIERRFTELAPLQAAALAGRVSGDSTVAYAWAYAMALESASGTQVPPRAAWIRALLLERERVANHLGDLGALGNDAALAFGQAQFSRLREGWQRLSREAFGHRLMMDVVVPGGVACDLGASLAASLCRQGDAVRDELLNLRAIYDEHAGLQDRLVGTGRVTPALARQLGLTGLAGRASGQPADLRCDHAWLPYETVKVTRATSEAGDVAARVAVRFSEALESLRLIGELAQRLPPGPLRAELHLPDHPVHGAGWVEGWRGEVFVAIELEHAAIVRCHCHDPSWQNWPVLEHAVIGNIVPDFPLINKSFNLSYSGHDL